MVVERYFVYTLLLKIGVGVEALPVLTGALPDPVRFWSERSTTCRARAWRFKTLTIT